MQSVAPGEGLPLVVDYETYHSPKQYVFDYKPGDVFGCMAVLGWITGHSYVVYGPLCNGATTLLFEGTATHPDNGMLKSYLLYISTELILYRSILESNRES